MNYFGILAAILRHQQIRNLCEAVGTRQSLAVQPYKPHWQATLARLGLVLRFSYTGESIKRRPTNTMRSKNLNQRRYPHFNRKFAQSLS